MPGRRKGTDGRAPGGRPAPAGPLRLAVAAAAVLAAGAAPAAGAAFTATVEYVVDGDTLIVSAGAGETTVRLIGVDTPETRDREAPVQCWGPEATARLRALLPRRSAVRLVTDPTQDVRDRYGRLLAYAFRPGRASSVNLALVATGYARAYVYDRRRPFLHAASYRRAEARARALRLGLWGPPCDGGTARP